MPRVRLSSRIDSGGFGEVYKAIIVDDGRIVALKRLSKPYSLEDSKRFGREVRIMLKLDHPNIIKVLYTNLEADPPLFIMPLAECNLYDIINEIRVDEDRRNLIFRQILEGIQYAHQNEIIHRDLKPQNILLFKGDRVCIADFGLGRFINRDTTTLTMKGEQLGTVLYSAPEQFEDFSKSDVRSDIYSLGKIFYQMITGRPVFPIPSLTGIDGRYVYMLQKCLYNEPEKRYQSVNELLDDFILLTQKQFNLESPTQAAQKLIVDSLDPILDVADTSSSIDLLKIFAENMDNKELYYSIFPKIPLKVVKKMIETNRECFLSVLEVYDYFVCGELRFDYCDVVTDYYYKIFDIVNEFKVYKMIIVRLLDMGHRHNRWHVRDILAIILQSITDHGIAKVALDACRSNVEGTKWSYPAINIDKLHPILRDGLREIIKPPYDVEEELPF